MSYSIKKASRAILSAKSIAIVSHINPDGDTLGCSLALAHALRGRNKKIHLLNASNLPVRYGFLPGYRRIKKTPFPRVDLAISVDCAGAERVGIHTRVFDAAQETLEIDHHAYGNGYCSISVVDTKAAATAEVMYDVIKGCKLPIRTSVATCLMAALVTDTISFSTNATRSKSLRIAGALIDAGADIHHITNQALKLKNPQEIRIQAHAFDKTTLDCNGALAHTILTTDDFATRHASMADAEDVPSKLMSIRGVRISAFFRQRPDGLYRTSLRCTRPYNVAHIAQRYHGGGHKYAAGCTVTKAELKHLLQDLKKVLTHAL